MRSMFARLAAGLALGVTLLAMPTLAGAQVRGAEVHEAQVQPAYANPGDPETFRTSELVESGHQLFGGVSRGLALAVQEAVRRWGEPNGYILGQEASGALFGGLRFGEGKLYTRNAGQHRVFWQGPSIGFDFGGDGARTMMLVYNLPSTDSLYRRFVGLARSEE